jgi:hypothetical protein
MSQRSQTRFSTPLCGGHWGTGPPAHRFIELSCYHMGHPDTGSPTCKIRVLSAWKSGHDPVPSHFEEQQVMEFLILVGDHLYRMHYWKFM